MPAASWPTGAPAASSTRDERASVLAALAGVRRAGRRVEDAVGNRRVAARRALRHAASCSRTSGRTRGPKEGRLRLLRATRTQLEPIFLLYEGTSLPVPEREPDLQSGGDRLWRVEDAPSFDDVELLIADGHHRYETALAYAEEGGSPDLMVVLVPTEQKGLTIFPTHRIAAHVNGAHGRPIDEPGDDLPGVVVYRDGTYELLDGDGLDVEVVERIAPDGVTYTPERREAIATVDRGEAEAAFLLRPTRIEDVWEVARRGETMPQKSTYFYPKLTSGLLFHPLD